MRDRIARIISAEKLTNQQFAMEIEISPASVTHILSGRNNPGLDVVVKIARRFPHYNLRWLVLGEEPIHNQHTAQLAEPIKSTPTAPSAIQQTLPYDNGPKQNPVCSATTNIDTVERNRGDNSSKLLICHPDGTYSEYIKRML